MDELKNQKCDYEDCDKEATHKATFEILNYNDDTPTGDILNRNVCDEHFQFSIEYKKEQQEKHDKAEYKRLTGKDATQIHELKQWLKDQIKWSDEQCNMDHISIERKKAYYYQGAAYETVLRHIESTEPTFCGTCSNKTDGSEFCCEQCSEYETI